MTARVIRVDSLRPWVLAFGVGCLVGLWWARLNTTLFNLTLLACAVACAFWMALLPRIGGRWVARMVAFLTCVALLGFPVYWLWEHDTTRAEIKPELQSLVNSAAGS